MLNLREGFDSVIVPRNTERGYYYVKKIFGTIYQHSNFYVIAKLRICGGSGVGAVRERDIDIRVMRQGIIPVKGDTYVNGGSYAEKKSRNRGKCFLCRYRY